MKKYGLNRVDFLKLDVQGAEFEIIACCPSSLLARVEYIAMEAHAGIANAETVLGEVPDYRRQLAGLIRKLAKTHLCVRGYPTRRSAVLGWTLRESVSWACVWRHRLRLWVVGPFVRFKAFLLVLAARILPGPVKAAIRRLIKR